ncbi:DUF221-domain-containing protein [Dentipellis sp. KUC8613]|nr:DUF221-domain-containing protein [Dentipellis sp. KUC8613]
MSDISSAKSSSTTSFLTSLVFNGAVFAAEIVAFTLIRRYFRLIYEPRALAPLKTKRTHELSPTLLGWVWALYEADYRTIRAINGMDAYFFVRFLRMMVRVFLPMWLLSWAILMPTYSVKTSTANHQGLDKFTFGNVANNQLKRFAALIIVTYIFTFWIWWNIKHEMRHFVSVRQQYLASPEHSSTAQANTILITGIPTELLSESALARLFSHLPGGVRKVWLNRDLKDMPELHDRRLSAAKTLESAETSLMNTATKRHNKQLKKAAKAEKEANGTTSSTADLTRRPDADNDPESARSLAETLVPQKKRPTHRLPLFSWMPFSLPLVGKKVDSIDWAREEIKVTSVELEKRRQILEQDIARTTAADVQARDRVHQLHAGRLNINLPTVRLNIPLIGPTGAPDFSDQTYPPVNGAFVLFNSQLAAHLAVQSLTHHEPYRMGKDSKYLEVTPEDVIWDNLGTNPYERRIRLAVSWSITIGLIILWAFPVAFVGAVSNVHSLCTTYSWLAWLCKLPKVVVGIISGILPPVLLAVLFLLLPIVLRLLARFEGIPTRSGVELSLMDRFFLFEVINGFLIVTFSSGIIAALPGIVKNVSSIPSLLAQNLPTASTFFLTYVILQGLSGTAGNFLQIAPLILYYVKLFLLGSTPRSVYNIKYGARTVKWGTLFPQTSLLVVIALGYSAISPIINGLACATFFLFYMVYKYNFIWVNDQPQSSDTGGLFFPKAIQHIFVGMYIQQICLAALFFLAMNDHSHPGAIPEGALMVVLIVFTAFYHNTINNSYGPLIHPLPLSIAEQLHGTNRSETEGVIDEQPPQGEPKPAEGADAGQENIQMQEQGSPSPGSSAQPSDSKRASHEPSIKRAVDRGPTDFSPPAAYAGQQIVWLPQDALGLHQHIVRALREDGIEVETVGARMDAKGHVDVDGPPPDMDEAERRERVGKEGSGVEVAEERVSGESGEEEERARRKLDEDVREDVGKV